MFDSLEAWRKLARQQTVGDLKEVIATFLLYTEVSIKSDILIRVLNERHEGWTLVWARGSWKGASEASAVVTISDAPSAVLETARLIRDALGQESVGVVRVGNGMVFV